MPELCEPDFCLICLQGSRNSIEPRSDLIFPILSEKSHYEAEVHGSRTHPSRRKPGHTGFEDQENHQILSTSGLKEEPVEI